MAKLFKIHSSLTLDTKKFTTSLKSASDRVTRFSRNMEKQAKKIGRSFKSAGRDLLFVAAIPAAIIVKSVKLYADMADEIGKLAKQTGIATEALTEYQHVAAITGITFEKWVDAIRFMQDAISSTIGDAPLKRLGLDKESLKQLAPEEAFEKIVKALGDVELAADKTGLSLDLFGRSGSIILRLVGTDFKALREEARKLNLSFSKAETKAAEDFNDNLSRLKSTVQGLSFEVAKILLPSLDGLVVTATAASASFNKWADDNKSFTSGLVNIGTGLTAVTVGAGASLFVVGQLAFALSSLIGVFGLLKTIPVVGIFARMAPVIFLAAAALALYNDETRKFLRDLKISRDAPNFFATKFEHFNIDTEFRRDVRRARNRFGVNNPGLQGPQDPEGFMLYLQNRTERRNRDINATYGVNKFGPEYQSEFPPVGTGVVEKLLEKIETNTRESQASIDALGGGLGASKAQPGSIF